MRASDTGVSDEGHSSTWCNTHSQHKQVARWARLEAAKQETSVSRLLGRILEERMMQQDEYGRAMRRALGRKPFPKTDGRYLSREEAHDRARLRWYQDPHLRQRCSTV